MKKLLLIFALLLNGCSYNPFVSNNHTTGSPFGALLGGAIAGEGVAALHGSKTLIGAAAIGGGMLGYYVTTLRFDAGPIYAACGYVYKVGNYIGIYIPSDQLFEPNTADFLPNAPYILDGVSAVLKRYPGNSVMISGNTSGFAKSRWEQRLSERRARAISAYLWNSGINGFMERSIITRKLNYVGYGDYFPVSQTYTNEGIRQNSRIQIISYPSDQDLAIDRRQMAVHNVGSIDDEDSLERPPGTCG